MNAISALYDTLKQQLKASGLTYRDVATALELSEANIKRLFAQRNFSLERLEKISGLLGLSLADLFALNAQKRPQLSQLTVEQEEELIADPKLLLVAVCAHDGWRFKDIIQQFEISEHECIRLLARLDRLKMVQLLPGNHIKLLIAPDFRWISNGPLERYINQSVLSTFMAGDFHQPQAFRFYLRGSFSASSLAQIHSRLNQLTQEVAELNRQDARLPLELRQHAGLLLALRPWEMPLFEAMKRTTSQE